MTRTSVVVASICGAVLVLLAACASGGSAGTGGSTPTLVRVGTTQQGSTVRVATGGRVVVTLDNTYWRLRAPGSPALRLLGVTPHPELHGIPGLGRGTVVGTYRAVSAGTATIVATRQTCGEALRCAPPQTRWSVTVVVRP